MVVRCVPVSIGEPTGRVLSAVRSQETNYELGGLSCSPNRCDADLVFSPTVRGLVLALLIRTRAAETALATLPTWRTWERAEAADVIEWGPRYRPSDWFGPTTGAERKRLLRAMSRLQAVGLVELIATPGGRRLSGLRFTPAGREAAERIPEASGTKERESHTPPKSQKVS